MAAIDLVVTDLDGTLWDGAQFVHPDTLAAWAEIERRGVPVLVATGRRVGSTAEPLAGYGLTPAAVCLNGAIGLDLADQRRFHRATIDTADALAILAAFRASGLQPCVYVDRDDVAVYLDPAPSTHALHAEAFGAAAVVADLHEVCATEAVCAFSVLGWNGGDEVATVAAAVGEAGIAHLTPDTWFGGTTLTVAGPAMSKWEGVLAYCADQGRDATRVLAIGDGPNDAELLSGAAVAVSLTDADPRAQALADHLVAPAVAGGWSTIVDLLD